MFCPKTKSEKLQVGFLKCFDLKCFDLKSRS